MTYNEAISWLYSLQTLGIKLGVDNTNRLLTALHLPHPDSTILHVAGTNGKGSTCAFLHSIATAHGHTTGLFTSPHLIRYNERIRVNHEDITDSDVITTTSKIKDLIHTWNPTPTFFECTLALALDHFKNHSTHITILETGMGGRLDATNATPIRPAACAITPIALDHQQWLGNSLTEIATEKAGIIRPETPVLVADQSEEALTAIAKVAQQRHAPMTIIHPPKTPSPLSLPGPHQQANAALALATLKAANIPLDPATTATALTQTHWPARFQILQHQAHTLIIDAAHNEAAAQSLLETWHQKFPNQSPTLIYATAENKEWPDTLKTLLPLAQTCIFTAPNSPRALDPNIIPKTLTIPHPYQIKPTTSQALDQALKTDPQTPILITGSLFLAGEALAHLTNTQHTHQPSTQ